MLHNPLRGCVTLAKVCRGRFLAALLVFCIESAEIIPGDKVQQSSSFVGPNNNWTQYYWVQKLVWFRVVELWVIVGP